MIMTNNKFLLTVVSFLAIVVVPTTVNGQALPDKSPSLIVEPYVGQWCANQFPDELSYFNGYTMLAMMKGPEQHIKLEPYLGEWCFDQFPAYLTPQLDRQYTITSLQRNHKQIEPYLEEWGKDSMKTPQDLISLEPYIGRWCGAQFDRELQTLTANPTEFHSMVRNNHVKLEPALAKWCFAQFPTPLKDIDKGDTLDELESKHVKVENSLIQWYLSMDATKTNTTGLIVWGSIVSVAFALTLAALFCVCYRRRRNTKEVDTANVVVGTSSPSPDAAFAKNDDDDEPSEDNEII